MLLDQFLNLNKADILDSVDVYVLENKWNISECPIVAMKLTAPYQGIIQPQGRYGLNFLSLVPLSLELLNKARGCALL